jgi:hypothetical protein
MRRLRSLALGIVALAAPASGAVVTDGYGQVFPPDNPWNIDVTRLPVHPNSANFVASIGSTASLHPDFGTTYGGGPWGIPYDVVPGTQTPVTITFTAYGGESDPGPYPFPSDAPIEGGWAVGGDRHAIVIDKDHHELYELFSAYPQSDGSWNAACGAVFDLTSNAMRPAGWTSADAAGLSIFAGLARYDEVAAGAITHALRFTVVNSQQAYLYPARHYASSSTDSNLAPMGLRFRLKASVDISGYATQARVILAGLKRYGMIVADNGGNWFLGGAPDPRWDDAVIDTLKGVHGSDFEAVDTSSMDPSINTVAPAAPRGLAIVPGDAQAALTWSANTEGDLLGYHVERASSSSGPWSRQTSAPLQTLAFSQSALSNGTAYWYRVIAEDYARNFSPASAALAVTPGGGTTTVGTSTSGGPTAGGATGSGAPGGSSRGGCGLGAQLGLLAALFFVRRRVRR